MFVFLLLRSIKKGGITSPKATAPNPAPTMQTETTALMSITAVNVASAVAVWIATHRHEKKRREPTRYFGGSSKLVRRWYLWRMAAWDDASGGDTCILVADLPCGGVMFARCDDVDLEEFLSGANADFRLRRTMVACPDPKRPEDRFCPFVDKAAYGPWHVSDDVQQRDAADPGVVHLEWRLAGVDYFQLPPWQPIPAALEPHGEARAMECREARVLCFPAPALLEALRARLASELQTPRR